MRDRATDIDEGRVPAYRRGLHAYACIVAGCTLLLIAAGGMVTSTGSGLSVPDWPTTYGHNMFTFPVSKWQGGIFYEHSHRLIASTVGMLTIGLAVWLQFAEPRRRMRRLGWVALGAVICQGILGGMTVKFLLPTWISVFHACLAQTFLCIVTSIAVFTSRFWIERGSVIVTSSTFAVPTLSIVLIGVVFCQLIAGAIMRHTQSGLAVPDFPLAYGQLLPKLDSASIAAYNESRAWDYHLPEITRSQIEYHLIHRLGAVVVTIAILLTSVTTILRHSLVSPIRRPAVVLLVLLVFQWALGAWTVLSGRMPIAATLHVAVGAATLATSVVLALRSRRLVVTVPQIDMPRIVIVGAAA